MAKHPMEDHLYAQTKGDDDWHCDQSQDRVVGGWSQEAHAMDPDHEQRGAPVMVVLHRMLALSINIAEGNLP